MKRGCNSFARTVRKLHRWELEHLREHAAALEVENERLRDELAQVESWGEMWHRTAEQMQESGDHQLGLMSSGEFVVLQTAPQSRNDQTNE